MERHSLDKLARSAMSSASFQQAAVPELRRIVGFDSMCWSVIDPSSWIPSWTVADNEVMGLNQRLLHPAWLRSGELLDLAEFGFAGAKKTVAGTRRHRSYWWELAEPAGLGDAISVALRVDGATWGLLHLYRDHDGRGFTHEDAAALTRLAPVLAAPLRRSVRTPRHPVSPTGEPGTVVLDRDLHLVALTDAATTWLDRLPQAVPGGDPLPGFVYALGARVLHDGELPARMRVRADDGTWLSMHAAALRRSAGQPAGDGGIAVTIEPARSAAMSPLLMRAHKLSPREREVASFVVAGAGNPDVAAALYITRQTVSDHLKAIYRKVGVSSRAELATALAGGTVG